MTWLNLIFLWARFIKLGYDILNRFISLFFERCLLTNLNFLHWVSIFSRSAFYNGMQTALLIKNWDVIQKFQVCHRKSMFVIKVIAVEYLDMSYCCVRSKLHLSDFLNNSLSHDIMIQIILYHPLKINWVWE